MKDLNRLIRNLDLDVFWQTVDDLDEVIDGKNYKQLIREYFSSDGKSKKLIANLKTDKQLQDWNDINSFVSRIVGRRMLIQKTRNYKAKRKTEIQERKESNHERRQFARGGRSVEES